MSLFQSYTNNIYPYCSMPPLVDVLLFPCQLVLRRSTMRRARHHCVAPPHRTLRGTQLLFSLLSYSTIPLNITPNHNTAYLSRYHIYLNNAAPYITPRLHCFSSGRLIHYSPYSQTTIIPPLINVP